MKLINAFKKALSRIAQFNGFRLIRASGPEDQKNAQRALEGTIIGGAIMFLAKPIAYWLTGTTLSSASSSLPTELVTIVNNLLSLLQYLGLVVLIAGFIYGGIKWSRKKEQKQNE